MKSEELIKILYSEVKPAVGCTEPVAVALEGGNPAGEPAIQNWAIENLINVVNNFSGEELKFLEEVTRLSLGL